MFYINQIAHKSTIGKKIFTIITALWYEAIIADYTVRVEGDSGSVENAEELAIFLDTLTEDSYNNATAIYNANAGYKSDKIYDVRDTDNTSPYDITATGGGGTRFNEAGEVESVTGSVTIDYSTGKAAFLITPTRTNYFTYSYDLTYAGGYSVEKTLDEVGITGNANTATTLANNTGVAGNKVIAGSGNFYYQVFSNWVKKDNNESRFPAFRFAANNNGSYKNMFLLNTKTGAILQVENDGTGSCVYEVKDRGNWWEIRVKIGDGVAKIASPWATQFPAYTNVWAAGAVNSTTGSIVVGHVQVSGSDSITSFISTPIITNGSIVTKTSTDISISVPAGVTEIEEKVDGIVNIITSIPSTYTFPIGSVEYVIFR
jgi:hypothetical protein